jgi:hypothetical protein
MIACGPMPADRRIFVEMLGKGMRSKRRFTLGRQTLRRLPPRIGCLLTAVTMFGVTTYALDALPPDSSDNHRFAIDSSTETSSHRNGFFYTNFNAAPLNGLNESGFRVRVTTGASWYRYISGEDPRTYGSGRSFESSALFGYALVAQRFGIIGLVGPTHVQSSNEGVNQNRWGVRAHLALDARPTDQTRFEGSVNYTTSEKAFQAKAKLGLKTPGDMYFGPEVRASGRDLSFQSMSITETRIGVHLSSIKIGPVYLGLSGGFAHNGALGWGNYGGLDIYASF